MKSPSETPILEVDRLTTVFALPGGQQAPAARDVSFSIQRGEVLALVGESGSGKSVTALSLIRLVPPPGRIAGGRIRFEGRDLLALSEREMRAVRGRRIGFVFQEPMAALDPVYTVGDQVAETLAAHGLARGAAARRRAVELFEAVRIPDPARRTREYPHQLSGGLRQRVMLALALAAEPSLVIADEPTTALDVTVQAEILDLLRDLRQRLGLTVLLITHDLGVVAEMADRVAVMYAGRIVERGRVAEVFAAPSHPYTHGLLACMPRLGDTGPLRAIPGSVPAIDHLPLGCAFAPRCDRRLDVCAAHDPPELETSATRTVRCFLHGGLPAGADRATDTAAATHS